MNVAVTPQPVNAPRIDRVRHVLKRRTLRVETTRRVTPNMLRITFAGEDLADFKSLGFDDHVKLFVPDSQERRDYTPRRFDVARRTLDVDFAVHDAGPATRWALQAAPGDTIEIGGPKGSAVVAPDVARWLLVGDETALPAMGRRIEEASSGTQITCLSAVTSAAERQSFQTRASLAVHWVHRPLAAGSDPAPLLAALPSIDLQPGTFVWIAGEATVARALRDHLVRRGHPLSWLKAAGYWVKGQSDVHEKIE